MTHARIDGMTAAELAAHLSELVNDDDFVMKAVRLKFPQYGQAGCAHTGSRKRLTEQQSRERIMQSKASYRERNYVKPSKDESVPWYDCRESREQTNAAIERGSRSLLEALHRSHPSILQRLASQGRQVVHP